MKSTRRDAVKDEVERDQHGHRLIDCVACDRKRTPQGAFGLCYTCYRREKRAQKPKTHMHPQGQQKEQIRLTKLYSQMMTAAISLGMDEDDMRALAQWMVQTLRAPGDAALTTRIRCEVTKLCRRHPVPGIA
jgi:hypothetical protein